MQQILTKMTSMTGGGEMESNMFENSNILIQINPHLEKQAMELLISSAISTLVIRDFIIYCHQT